MNNKTNWSKYYKKKSFLTYFTRFISFLLFYFLLLRCFLSLRRPLNVLELGGADSFVIPFIINSKILKSFTIVDNNKTGLNVSRKKYSHLKKIKILEHDITQRLILKQKFDFVFSIGVIEHFDHSFMHTVIDNHLKLVTNGGYLYITYPTPTWLYRTSRKFITLLGLWIFFDENPLVFQDISKYVKNFKILHKFTAWPLILTQECVFLKSIKDH